MVLWIILSIVVVMAIVGIVFVNQPSFGRIPRGERLARIERSPNYRDGAFRNIHETPLMTSDKGRLQGLLDFGKRVLVDPVFCMASPVSFINKPFKGTDVYHPEDMPDIDYLVISHDHWDHLDYHTVRALKDRIGKVICGLGVGEHFEYWGFDKERIIELDWEEEVRLDSGFVMHCLPARHFSGRGLPANKTLWASFLLETPSRKIYLAGDGGYDTHFARIGDCFPGIDLAILENGQYNEGWKYIHLMPDYLTRAALDLKAKKVMTVHHSKYALAHHHWDEPLRNEMNMAKNDSLHVLIPVIGEVVRWGE